jgi:hypothetical protein
VGSQLREDLTHLQAALAGRPTVRILQQTAQRAETELEQWGRGTADYYQAPLDRADVAMYRDKHAEPDKLA